MAQKQRMNYDHQHFDPVDSLSDVPQSGQMDSCLEKGDRQDQLECSPASPSLLQTALEPSAAAMAQRSVTSKTGAGKPGVGLSDHLCLDHESWSHVISFLPIVNRMRIRRVSRMFRDLTTEITFVRLDQMEVEEELWELGLEDCSSFMEVVRGVLGRCGGFIRKLAVKTVEADAQEDFIPNPEMIVGEAEAMRYLTFRQIRESESSYRLMELIEINCQDLVEFEYYRYDIDPANREDLGNCYKLGVISCQLLEKCSKLKVVNAELHINGLNAMFGGHERLHELQELGSLKMCDVPLPSTLEQNFGPALTALKGLVLEVFDQSDICSALSRKGIPIDKAQLLPSHFVASLEPKKLTRLSICIRFEDDKETDFTNLLRLITHLTELAVSLSVNRFHGTNLKKPLDISLLIEFSHLERFSFENSFEDARALNRDCLVHLPKYAPVHHLRLCFLAVRQDLLQIISWLQYSLKSLCIGIAAVSDCAELGSILNNCKSTLEEIRLQEKFVGNVMDYFPDRMDRLRLIDLHETDQTIAGTKRFLVRRRKTFGDPKKRSIGQQFEPRILIIILDDGNGLKYLSKSLTKAARVRFQVVSKPVNDSYADSDSDSD